MSNLTEDVELTFTQGMAIYYGDIYEMGSDAWNVVLAEADYDLDINYGQGDAVQLAFNVTHGAGDYIPDGPYTLLDANTAEELPAGTMIAGIYDAPTAVTGAAGSIRCGARSKRASFREW